MTIVPVYAALLGLIFVYLSMRVIKARRQEKVAVGTGGNLIVERAMRVHANFAEYVPFTLLLFAFVEQKGVHPLLVHFLCLLLLTGRIVHLYGVSKQNEIFRFRVVGMTMTFAAIMIACMTLIVGSFVL